VIKRGATASAVENTGGVVLENTLISLEGDGKDTGLKGSLHLVGVVSGDVNVSLSVDGGVGVAVVLAGTVTGGVSVSRFEGGVVGLVVLEGLVLPTTIATVA
jgi:hypothetical protein